MVRDLVRECLMSILRSGDITDAAAVVRRRLLDIVEDKVPLEAYAISKNLRKNIQDTSHPMSAQELREIREQLGSHGKGELSYAEIDQAIRAKIRLPWRSRVKLPHVVLAWKLRMQDPSAAPVLGESISYVIINSGAKQIADKAETLERVAKNPALVLDRNYYLTSLEIPMQNIFMPVFLQRLLLSLKKDKAGKDDELRAHKMVKDCLWACIKAMPLTQDSAKRQASIAASPIAMLFKKQRQT